MRQAQHQLSITTRGKGLVEITPQVKRWVAEQGIATGLLTLYCRHTSASLLIQENADPDVQTDLTNFFEEIAPEKRNYVHHTEGADDMSAHIRTALTHTSLSIPVRPADERQRVSGGAKSNSSGKLALGTWQGIYLFEHRRAPHTREVVLHLIGE
jgi:secondary thiamine-phosphate synthase enzyme